jgi:chemotaxis protein MotB
MIAALATFLLVGAGCSDNKLKAERDSLNVQNKDLTEKNQALEQAHQADQSKIDALTRQLSAAPAPAADTATPSMTGGPLELDTPPGRSGASRTAASGRTTTPVSTRAPTRVKLPGEVLFDSGKTSLSSSATKTLDSMAAAIKKSYSGEKIVIEGFTDSTPVKSTAANLKTNEALAEARAKSVMTYLAKKGIPTKDMSTKSMGESKSGSTAAQNRRVEVVVLK